MAEEMKAESQALIDKEISEPGSRMETEAIETWKNNNPTLYRVMKERGALEATAHVVVHRILEQAKRMTKAGMPPSEARTEAYRDQMMLD
jgi:hypothetical protein